MQIIPVLDLMGGSVVRARLGDRASYRPIETPLAEGSAPVAVAAGLLGLSPFRVLYVADLDGIMHGRPDLDSIDALASAFPAVEWWVDNGIASWKEADAVLKDRPSVRLVIGSETQTSDDLLRAIGARAVLSLDFRGDAFQGPPDLLADPTNWPEDVIVMTLARVGSGAGPDLERLADVRRRAGTARRVHAAGGVRDADDLHALARRGLSGALVATALHDGRLDAAALSLFDERGPSTDGEG